MRQEIGKNLAWCLSCAARTNTGRKRIGGLLPFNVGIRFKLLFQLWAGKKILDQLHATPVSGEHFGV